MSTDLVLVLGLVIFIAIILLLGWTRIVSPLLKYSYSVQAEDVALSLDAAAAAPERLNSMFIISAKPQQKGADTIYAADRRIECTDTVVHAQVAYSADSGGTMNKEPSPRYVKDKNMKSYSCTKTYGTYSLQKTWDYQTMASSLRAID